jgi:Prenyltransferase and squalene oxidase repeat
LKLPMKNYGKAIAFLIENAKGFEDIRIAAAGFESFEIATGEKPKAPDQWMEMLKKLSDESGKRGSRNRREAAGLVVTGKRLDPPRTGNTRNKSESKLEAALLEFLNGGQNKDGAFGKDESGESDLESSYRVLRCYHMLKAKPAKANALREFISKCRNSDGGYGVQPGKPSQVSGTYFAAIILHWLNEP